MAGGGARAVLGDGLDAASASWWLVDEPSISTRRSAFAGVHAGQT